MSLQLAAEERIGTRQREELLRARALEDAAAAALAGVAGKR